MRTVDPRQLLAPEPREPAQAIWFRLVAPIGDDPALHRAILAYASDFALLGTSTLPHGINWLIHDMQTASLDHALWLHEPFRADEWLLYTTDSPWAGHARGFNRGRIFAADGRLVASVAQEGLIRLRSAPVQKPDRAYRFWRASANFADFHREGDEMTVTVKTFASKHR
ncbi:hypothetical protein GCM10020258_48100 [Sphingomonas yabuuchiae]